MPSPYARWINRWENRLARRDANRVVRPFEWGLEWLGLEAADGEPAARIRQWADQALADTDAFFAYRRPGDCRVEDDRLTFTSPLASPYAENNLVHASFFPARERRRAVVVLPQWNSSASGHVGLCRLLNRFGICALRLSLPYHDRRMPAELKRADYHVSANIGRTVHACRQAVIDTRACLDWLEAQGYQRLGLLGTSLGSAVAFIAAAHDRRLRAGAYNLFGGYFADVVWTGLPLRHVHQGLEGHVPVDELREYWKVISPIVYVPRLAGRVTRNLFIRARYDTTFLPEFALQFLALCRSHQVSHHVVVLPCAHYTTGEFPFKWLDGLAMCRFLARHL
ncbi:MAG: abhydrolase domain-containing 18 [Acidobacteria bacterium]|nr:abhydrolase domain-containing 18 [Acidobacteriota bacterium]